MGSTLILILAMIGLCALQLMLGMGVGVWLRRDEGERGKMESNHARQLLDWLARTTSEVSVDVDEHQQRIAKIDQKLAQLEAHGEVPVTDLVIEVVGDIMQANERLKDLLASAEIRLKQQAQEIEKHLSHSLTDSLTRLPNRRAFDDDLRRRFAAWQRRGTPLSVLLLDIDHFKKLNDTYGHLAGDRVLTQVAGVLKRSLRAMDMIARHGGEEFAVILPDTVHDNAMAAARHAIDAVERTQFAFEGVTIQLTISAGVATALADEDVTHFVRRADDALYASKNAGRNCGHFHDGRECVAIARESGESGGAATLDQSPTERVNELDDACHALRDHVAEITRGQ